MEVLLLLRYRVCPIAYCLLRCDIAVDIRRQNRMVTLDRMGGIGLLGRSVFID